MTDRIRSIDALRGLTAFSICLFHLGRDSLFHSESPVLVVLNNNPFHVQVFWVISGYVIGRSLARRQALIPFVRRRIRRLEPAFLASVALVVVLNALSSLAPGYRGQPFSPEWFLVLLNALHVNALFDLPFINAVYWTLFVEWQFYLFMALLAPLFFRLPSSARVLALVLLAIPALRIPDHLNFLHHMGYFGLGTVLWMRREQRLSSGWFAAGTAALAALSFAANRETWLHWLGAMLAFGIILADFRLPDWGGRTSYALFLTHIPIGTRLTHLAARWVVSEPGRLVIVILAAILCRIFAGVFHRFTEPQPLPAS